MAHHPVYYQANMVSVGHARMFGGSAKERDILRLQLIADKSEYILNMGYASVVEWLRLFSLRFLIIRAVESRRNNVLVT